MEGSPALHPWESVERTGGTFARPVLCGYLSALSTLCLSSGLPVSVCLLAFLDFFQLRGLVCTLLQSACVSHTARLYPQTDTSLTFSKRREEDAFQH